MNTYFLYSFVPPLLISPAAGRGRGWAVLVDRNNLATQQFLFPRTPPLCSREIAAKLRVESEQDTSTQNNSDNMVSVQCPLST